VALAGVTALQASGSAHTRLAAWISGAEQATLQALMQLERLAVWRQTARATLADMQGRTPALLIEVFAAWPMVPAPLAEAETGASRAAVQRNLDQLAQRGLIREITGQGRYRVWVAKL
jgi:Fic family protein